MPVANTTLEERFNSHVYAELLTVYKRKISADEVDTRKYLRGCIFIVGRAFEVIKNKNIIYNHIITILVMMWL